MKCSFLLCFSGQRPSAHNNLHLVFWGKGGNVTLNFQLDDMCFYTQRDRALSNMDFGFEGIDRVAYSTLRSMICQAGIHAQKCLD